MAAPPLTFFVELAGAELSAMLAQPGILAQLQARGAALSMAMLDLSPQRAEAIRALTAHGIPVTAWLVLEPGEGYWLTADNAPQAAQRYTEIRAWALAQDLVFARVGLDIEVPYADAAPLFDAPLRTVVGHLRNARSDARILEARQAYAALIERIRADGYATETYHIPLLLDERKAGSQLLRSQRNTCQLFTESK